MSDQPPSRGPRRGTSLGYSSPRGNSGYARGGYPSRGRGRPDSGTGYYRSRGGYNSRSTFHSSHASHGGEPYPNPRGGYRGRSAHMRPYDNSYSSRSPTEYNMPPSSNYNESSEAHHKPYTHEPRVISRGPFEAPILSNKNNESPAGLRHEYTVGLALKQEMEKSLQLANKTTGYYIGFISKHGNQIIPSFPRDL